MLLIYLSYFKENFMVKRRRKTFKKEEREMILKRTDYRCYSCGLKMSLNDDWWVEHILPHSHEGSDNIENLLPSCRLCNSVRSNFKPETIRKILWIGYAMIHEVGKKTDLGLRVMDFMNERELKLSKRRKHRSLALNPDTKSTIRADREKIKSDNKSEINIDSSFQKRKYECNK
jgi:hypothetical protein